MAWDNIVKFPFSVSRRAHARKPRASINGTPEERSSKAEVDAPEMVAARGDRRKLRGNPLRESYGLISPAVTIIGKIYTAKLRQDGWWEHDQ
jgi:hypothetical protein